MALTISVSKEELIHLVNNQLMFFNTEKLIDEYMDQALSKTEVCFSHCTNKYYSDSCGKAYFSPYQSAQYGQFLYFLSRSVFLSGESPLAEKIYLLNKMLHSVDWFYEVELPDIFFADHPIGSVLGRAKYSNRFSISQGCTVGNNHNIFPRFEENVTMRAQSTVIGNSHIGRNVEISAYAFIRDEDIPDNSIVFGQSPNLVIKEKSIEYMESELAFFKYE